MTDRQETATTPKCPTCGALMIAPEGTYLCTTALAQSYQDEDGTWRRLEESHHPMREEEIDYLVVHGMYRQFI